MEVNKVIQGDCLEILKDFPDNSIDNVITDPPYGLSKEPDMKEVLTNWLNEKDYEHNSTGFMGRSWDSFVPSPSIWEEVFRVLKPNGLVMSFSGTRTNDLALTSMRIASDRVKKKLDVKMHYVDDLVWTYGSGFPKSMNIGKALTKKGELELAEQYKMYGTAIKPAHEPIVVFRKESEEKVTTPNGGEFIYTAKTPKKERNAGCEGIYWADGQIIPQEDYEALETENELNKDSEDYKAHKLQIGNTHNTVKPLSLMRYLVQCTGGLILDPFAGSGSTLAASRLENRDTIGIELEESSVVIAETRMKHWESVE